MSNKYMTQYKFKELKKLYPYLVKAMNRDAKAMMIYHLQEIVLFDTDQQEGYSNKDCNMCGFYCCSGSNLCGRNGW